MFVLFDVAGSRSANGNHVKDPEAKERAEKRRRKNSKVKKEGKGAEAHDAVVKPKLDEELKKFKAIVRNIATHELDEHQKGMFLMDDRSKLRRLAKLGIQGHQPAIKAFCQISEEEKESIVQSLLQQKVGSNPKSNKAYREFAKRKKEQEEGRAEGEGDASREKLRVRRSRIAVGTTVRWQRVRNKEELEEEWSQDEFACM